MDPIQVCGSAIINEEDELLLLWKIKDGHYVFPGGKKEGDETFEETALREAKEEIGVVPEIVEYYGHEPREANGKLYELHVFLARLKPGQTPEICEKEIFSEILWMPINNYASYQLAPNVRDFCKQYTKENLHTLWSKD